MEENRFCFIAVVSNEAPIIERCLRSTANVASSYLFCCDTKSNDGTEEIIREHFKNNGIRGEVIVNEWKNYGQQKTHLLREAKLRFPDAKYWIWHDADEVFLTKEGDHNSFLTKSDADKLYKWLESRSEPIFYIQTHFQDLKYPRWNIARNNQSYKWEGPKHEQFEGEKDNRHIFYGGFYLLARRDGNAAKDPLRHQKDVKMFMEYINEQGGFDKTPFFTFYLAQEYEGWNDKQAILFYKMVIELMDDSDSYKYITCLRLGHLVPDPKEKIKYWKMGLNLNPERLECPFYMMAYFMDKDWSKALKYGMMGSENRKINPYGLFFEHEIYDYLYDLKLSVTADYNGKSQLASDLNQRNMNKNKNKPDRMGLLLNNQSYFDKNVGLENKLVVARSVPNISRNRSPDIRPNLIVIDDFYSDPDAIRELALSQEFGVRGNYPGQRTESFRNDEIKARFENIAGKKITYWPDGYNGSFQYTIESDKSWIHRDATDFSAIIYLTPNAPLNAGTIIYRHKESGRSKALDKSDEEYLQSFTHDPDAWEIVDVVGNRYNRCIMFNGRLSHMSNQYFGTTKENGRLFQTFFFDMN